jgi:hypothetical protein
MATGANGAQQYGVGRKRAGHKTVRFRRQEPNKPWEKRKINPILLVGLPLRIAKNTLCLQYRKVELYVEQY